MSIETSKGIPDIIDLAVAYFNGHFGLNVSEYIPECCAEFRDEKNRITIQVIPKGFQNEVILTSQAWEYQIFDFLKAL
ncbi:MAG: hypothetical protein ACFFED_06780 [Candidatus Thorarchaeota archaeon]